MFTLRVQTTHNLEQLERAKASVGMSYHHRRNVYVLSFTLKLKPADSWFYQGSEALTQTSPEVCRPHTDVNHYPVMYSDLIHLSFGLVLL